MFSNVTVEDLFSDLPNFKDSEDEDEEILVDSLLSQNERLQLENKEQLLTMKCLEEKLLHLQRVIQQQQEKIQEYESPNNFDKKILLLESSIKFSQESVVNKNHDLNKTIDKWENEPPTNRDLFHQTKNNLELELDPLTDQYQQLDKIFSQASNFLQKFKKDINDTHNKITRIAHKKETNLLEECNICKDSLTVDKIDKLECGHPFCTDCIQRYVRGSPSRHYICPVCKHTITPDYLQYFMRDNDDFLQRLDIECLKSALGEEFITCPICSSCYHKDGQNLIQANCPECNKTFCTKCHVAWHVNMKCEEYQKQLLNPDLLKLIRSQNWKQCPHCKEGVEKASGCNHMKCIQCKTEFCYSCGEKISSTANHYTNDHPMFTEDDVVNK